MTDSDEPREGLPPDGEMPADIDAEREARLVAKANAKAVKAVKKAAKSEAKAVARAAEAADKAAKKAVKAAAKADARAVRAVRKVEREAAKAEAKAQREIQRKAAAHARAAARAREAEAARASLQSPAVATASAVLQEAAELLRQGERPTPEGAEPPAEVGPTGPSSSGAQDADPAAADPAEAPALEPAADQAELPEGEPEAEQTEGEAVQSAPEPEATEPGDAGADARRQPGLAASGWDDPVVSAEDPAPEAPAWEAPAGEEPAREEPAREEPALESEAPTPVPDEPAPGPDVEAATAADPGVEPDSERPEPAPASSEAERAPESGDGPATPGPESTAETAALLPEPARMPVLAPGETPAALLKPPTGGPPIDVPPGATVAAAIDVGATSVHLLVGTVDGHRVVPLLDESVFLGLGDRVSAEGYVGDEGRAALVGDLERYVAASRELGANAITIVGTDPLRRAQDASSVVQAVTDQLAMPLHVLDHAEEGLLTLIGATGGRPVSGELLLVDIGGGSSEFVVVRPDGLVRSVGIPLGAARLTRELVRTDPPSLAEIEALRAEAARKVAEAPDASPVEIVAVGGTVSNLLRLLPATAVDRSLTRRRIAVALAMLTVERSGEAAVRHLIRPERARILPAGAIVVDAILEKYRADRLRVSEEGIREGAILAAAHGGTAWRDRLAAMSRGWVGAAR